MPTDLKELASAIATYERLIGDINRVEKTFPPITDQMLTLGMYHKANKAKQKVLHT